MRKSLGTGNKECLAWLGLALRGCCDVHVIPAQHARRYATAILKETL
jgi:hypothetical protein